MAGHMLPDAEEGHGAYRSRQSWVRFEAAGRSDPVREAPDGLPPASNCAMSGSISRDLVGGYA